ncbi:hypothetical protein V6N12_034442 [Hibiscus sabdariffa]|uniref:Uncharacterized protein n=1 Tax=Hibiscus sabdariffa TaxID=183260 RepID=A0ABR2DI50_9ROSI
MVVKFDSHVNNLFGISTVGILSHGFVIVVSRPCLGDCKEDMRFYMRDLLTGMKIGDVEMKKQALGNLYQVMADDEKYVNIVVEIGETRVKKMEKNKGEEGGTRVGKRYIY